MRWEGEFVFRKVGNAECVLLAIKALAPEAEEPLRELQCELRGIGVEAFLVAADLNNAP